ncbi:DNA primase [Legionella sp. CNM-1927-20]|uniref:DNA primase n=1 Tax=Legionella sp. CNM-1927-20 TaxID=3422221 RepID=UPI00403AB0ED
MSGLIPRPFLDELLHRTDLVELIDSYVPLKKRGNSYTACCPFHNEKTPSFNVVAKKQFYHCFGCGASGNAISFVMSYLSQGFIDAVETLASRLGMQIPREQNQEKIQQSLSLYQLLAKVNQYYQKSLKSAPNEVINYLRSRGLTGEMAKHFQLGYALSGWHTLENEFKDYKADLITTGMLVKKDDGKTYDRYRHRIMFPIHDRNGRIIGFGGRAIDKEQKPKYLNSPETIIFQKNRELYGLHQVLQQKATISTILIVEGYLDVIALAQFGIINAVAALGTAASSYHIQLLSKHTKQVIFCFDGDEAGRQAAWRALENSLPFLDNNLDARFVFLPEGHDPDSLVRTEGKEKFLEHLGHAIPLSQYFFDTLAQKIDMQSVAGRSQLISEAKPFLSVIPESTYKQLLLDELALRTRIENHRLSQLLTSESIPSPKLNTPVHRSPLRLAIALLLQHPEIYSACKDSINLATLDTGEQQLLQQLIKQIAANPNTNTATLIEQWRNTSFFDSFNKLASWELEIAENALITEFVDILNFMQKQNLEHKINEYIAKSRKQGLTETERLLLQKLLQQRHQTATDKK